MKVRFISWNIHGRRNMESLLRTTQGDLVALQEVTVNGYQDLIASKLFAWSAFSLDLRSPRAGEKGRHLGCLINWSGWESRLYLRLYRLQTRNTLSYVSYRGTRKHNLFVY